MHRVLNHLSLPFSKTVVLHQFCSKTSFNRFLHFSACRTAKSIDLLKPDEHISLWKEKAGSQRLIRLIEAYQNYGHHVADINPLYSVKSISRSELLPETYNLLDNKEVQLNGKKSV